MFKNIFLLGLLLVLVLTFNVINTSQVTFQAIFKNVDGLPKGAPVTALGVRIGKVVRTKPANGGVLVTIKITKKGFTAPEPGSRLAITSFRPGQGRVIELIPPGDESYDELSPWVIQEPITNESWLHAALEILDGIEQFSKKAIIYVTPENFDKTRTTLKNTSSTLNQFVGKFTKYQESLTDLNKRVSERAEEGKEIVGKANKILSSINENLKINTKETNEKFLNLKEELYLISLNLNDPSFPDKIQTWKMHLHKYLDDVNFSLIEDGKKTNDPIYKEKYFEFKKGIEKLNILIDNFDRNNLLSVKEKVKHTKEMTEKVNKLTKQN